ncbi:MAG: 3-deoxy-D-manno-octulosonic acid transferase [bacterium]|nr:3-deoxy-D-manno-octulosonic acid transferase [bacterium]
MYFLYNSILFIFLLILSPLILFKVIRGGGGTRELSQRLGMVSADLPEAVKGGGAVWFHAASVGEVLASAALIEKIRHRWPEKSLLVSTFTATGNKAAIRKLNADAVIFLPFDLAPIVKRLLLKIRPSLLILMETELWPGLITEASSIGTPVVVVNGRISDSSFGKYKMLGPLIKGALSRLRLVLTQSSIDSERLAALGVDSARLHETGNVKFDMSVDNSEISFFKEWGHPLFIAGSTRDGEEPYIFEVYLKLREIHPGLRLLLAPRHIERAGEIARMMDERGLDYTLRSKVKGKAKSQLILLDTLGELSSCYKYADLVFIGGSLVPMGGQNMLEPALQGKPVLFGPYIENFREAAAVLTKGGGAVMVKDAEDLLKWSGRLLADDKLRHQMGAKARETVLLNRGATAKTVDMLAGIIDIPNS